MFLTDTVVTRYGTTFANKLKFENRTDRIVNLKSNNLVDESLLKIPDNVMLKSGEVKVFPVKYFTSPAIFSSASKQIIVSYTDQSDGNRLTASFIARLNQPDKISIAPTEPIVYLNSATGITQFRLHCSNNGYTTVNAQLKFMINPQGLQIVNPISNVILKPGEEQMIEFEAYLVNTNITYSPDFNITIECNDLNGTNLTVAVLHVTSLGSYKSPSASQDQFNHLSNATELSYTYLNKTNTYYSIRTNGNIALDSSDRVAYHVNLNYYDPQHTTDGYDTWINYRNQYWGVQVGSIMDDLDYSLYGRGIKLSGYIDQHNSVDFYYGQNNYLLFSRYTNLLPSATIFAGSYNLNYSGYGGAKLSLLSIHDPLTGIDTRFTNGNVRIAVAQNQRLELKFGYSTESSADLGTSKDGGAIGLNYSYRSDKFGINLNNYYSSSYYSGLQRGVTQLYDEVNYRVLPNANIFADYELLKNSPKYLVDTLSLTGFYNNTYKYAAGIGLHFKSVNITLNTYLFNQDMNQGAFAGPYLYTGPLSSSSYRWGVDLNYPINNNQQIFVVSDFGITHSDNPYLSKPNYSGLKITANYNNRWWGINTLIQNAPYYLSEESIAAMANKPYRAYALGPAVHFTTAKNRLSVAVNDYLNYESYGVGRTNSLNAQLQYQLKSNWQIEGQLFYNAYAAYNSYYSLQAHIGISKQFISNKQPGLNKLELVFFEDNNNDQYYENGEQLIEGLIINLVPENENNNIDLTAITNKQGIVNYINLKKNVYNLFIMRSNGWHMAHPIKIDLQNNKKIMIPMVKSGWLKGYVVPVKQPYITTKPILEGIKVIAVDDEGQAFTTLTNEDGEFELPLPLNHYHINIAVDSQKFSISNPNQEVVIRQNENPQIQFNITDESRKVIVKQF